MIPERCPGGIKWYGQTDRWYIYTTVPKGSTIDHKILLTR